MKLTNEGKPKCKTAKSNSFNISSTWSKSPILEYNIRLKKKNKNKKTKYWQSIG